MAVKLFKPKVDSISLFNKSGVAISDIKNIEGTDGLLVTYKDGSQEIFENYKYLINYDGVKETYDPTTFESINLLEDSTDINIGDIVYYNGDFIVVDQEFIDNVYLPIQNSTLLNDLKYYFSFNNNFFDIVSNVQLLDGTPKYVSNFVFNSIGLNFDGSNYTVPSIELLSDVAIANAFNDTDCPAFTSGAKTFSAWVRLDSGTDFILYNTGAATNGFAIGIKDNKQYLITQDDDTVQIVYGNNTINVGEIHFLTFIVDADDKIIKLYIDGNLDVTTDLTVLPGERWSRSFIGGANTSTTFYDDLDSHYTIGTISDLSIYNRSLTDSEIQELYENKLAGYFLKKLVL